MARHGAALPAAGAACAGVAAHLLEGGGRAAAVREGPVRLRAAQLRYAARILQV